MKSLVSSVCLLILVGTVHAGYEQPCYIDGGQSADGRFVVTAAATELGKTVHGPNRWSFTWKDTQSGQTATFPAQGVQAGQVYGQLYVAPDGETFALWNHVTLWTSGKSEMHGPHDLPYHEESESWRKREEFSRRLIVYRKDGTIVKELGVGDFLQPDEWMSVGRVFNRVHWIQPYDKLDPKQTARPQYAYCRVSPDYTVLEFRPVPPRSRREPRVVRVSLTDGRLLTEELSDPRKVPVRPFCDDDQLPHTAPGWRENYVPSLDPVRSPGTFRIQSAAEAWPRDKAPKQPPFSVGEVRLLSQGYKKADTPAWLPKASGGKSAGALLFTDLDQSKLFLLTPPTTVTEARAGATRGKVGPDGRFYGIIDGTLASWRPGEEPQTILAPADRELSLNDLVLSARGRLYFTTLKDPEKGRLSVVDVARKTVRVLFDGESEASLWNPNGIALSPDERFLFVGISSYKNLGRSGVYCFPILADGSIDVALGRAAPWAPIKSPDGIAVDKAGNVYFTAGGVVQVFDRYARPWGTIKIPRGSGSNLGFGGENQQTLYVTTFDALYAVDVQGG